jgi:hypothetical protein
MALASNSLTICVLSTPLLLGHSTTCTMALASSSLTICLLSTPPLLVGHTTPMGFAFFQEELTTRAERVLREMMARGNANAVPITTSIDIIANVVTVTRGVDTDSKLLSCALTGVSGDTRYLLPL